MNGKQAAKLRQIAQRDVKTNYKNFCMALNNLSFKKRLFFAMRIIFKKMK